MQRVAERILKLENHASQSDQSYIDTMNSLSLTLNKTNTRFSTISEKINVNHKLLKSMVEEVTNFQQSLTETRATTLAISKALNKLSDHVRFSIEMQITVVHSLEMIMHSQRSFLQGLRDTLSGHLSPLLVEPSDITIALRKVKQDLLTNSPNYHLLHEDINFYYTHHFSMLMYSRHHLFIHVQAPITTGGSVFSLH